jgi:hypothetical protein
MNQVCALLSSFGWMRADSRGSMFSAKGNAVHRRGKRNRQSARIAKEKRGEKQNVEKSRDKGMRQGHQSRA